MKEISCNESQVKPTVTVIIPCYNVESFVHEALDSVKKQIHQANQVLIINDGSADATLPILLGYDNLPGWKVISTENRGLGPARNLGASLATSDYLMFLDSDDYIEKDLILDFIKIYKKKT